nr:cellulose binding domain-containing protein [Streptomyces sp. HPF1205]
MSVLATLALVLAAVGTALGSGTATAAPAAGTGGCGKAPSLSSGTHNITSSGQNRSYILRVPANYDQNHPYRLIFGFPWLGGTANDVDSGGTDGYNWSYYGLRRLADQANNGTIFVAPQGINNGWANTNGQDITFVDDMLKQLEGGLCVDTGQIFSSGFSYGAAMTYALACARPTVFRAVAVYSGANLSGCSGGTQPVAYIGLHGLRDNVLPIANGRSLRDTFVRNNGCTPQNPPEPAYGSLTHIVTAYSGCKAGYPVVWAAFDGAGHDPGPIDGCTCDGWHTWTSGVVWNFFTQFDSTGGTTTGGTTTGGTTTGGTTTGGTTTGGTTTGGTTTGGTTTGGTTTGGTTTGGTTTGGTGNGACSATYSTTNSWSGGFQGQVTVTAGSAAISGWTVKWTLAGGQTVTQVWNGTLTTSGSTATVTNASYNGSLAAGGSTTFGFLANGTPSTPTLTCTSA